MSVKAKKSALSAEIRHCYTSAIWLFIKVFFNWHSEGRQWV